MSRGRVPDRKAFSPASLPGLQVWLRSDLGITLNGSTVSAWADQSGLGNHFTQGTAAVQPAYSSSDANFAGKPSVRFTATDSNLACGNSITARQIFAVAYYPTTTFTDYACILTSGSSNGHYVWRGESGAATWRVADAISGTRYRDGTQSDTALTATARAHVYDITLAADRTASTWQLGDTIGTAGSQQWSDGIVEVIIVSAALSAGKTADVRNYLKARYGTP